MRLPFRISRALLLIILVPASLLHLAFAEDLPLVAVGPARATHADFKKEKASAETRQTAHWIVNSGDNQHMPFAIIDKVNARVFVFDAGGQLSGAAAVLLGLARGDDSTPGIGQRELSAIRPEERTTPAGRFVASLSRDVHGVEMLWVDYETSIALHRVVTANASERRAQRLESDTTDDKRISYGCINVPVKFYDKVISPTFTGTNGMVYILPETRSAREVFKSYDVDVPALGRLSAQTQSIAAH